MSVLELHNGINDFSTTLSSSYTAGSTSLSLTSLTGSNGLSLPTLGMFYLKCEDEYFLVTENTGSNPLTVLGAQCGSTSVNHASGTTITGCRVVPAVLDSIRDYRADIMSSKPIGSVKSSYKREYYTLSAGASVDILPTLNGPGIVDCFNVGTAQASSIQVFYDGEGSPSIDVDLMDFLFQRKSAHTFAGNLVSAGAADTGGPSSGGMSYVPLPFTTSIRIQITNTSGVTNTLWTVVSYQTGIPNVVPRQQKLLISAGSVTGAVMDDVITMLNYTGGKKGRLLGFLWAMEGIQNAQEGNFKFYKNSGASLIIESTDTEGYFGMGGYFSGWTAPTISPSIGLTKNASGTYTAFRFFLRDPIFFEDSMKMTWNCGDSTQSGGWGSTVDMWYSVLYYTEL